MNIPIHVLLAAVIAMAFLAGCRDENSVSAQSSDPATARAATTDTPWAVPPQVAINKETKTFASAGAQLSGTLYYPEAREKLAAVIVFHAAAEPSQDAEMYTHLKQMLPPLAASRSSSSIGAAPDSQVAAGRTCRASTLSPMTALLPFRCSQKMRVSIRSGSASGD